LSRRGGKVTRLLLLLLLELLLVLLGDRRHCWHPRGHALLGSLAEASKLRLQLAGPLGRLQAWVAGVLLLERSLTKAGRLRGERARLLLLLLLLWLPGPGAERATVLRSTGALGVGPEERIRVRVHDAGVDRIDSGRQVVEKDANSVARLNLEEFAA
jgi:hypothetical protein